MARHILAGTVAVWVLVGSSGWAQTGKPGPGTAPKLPVLSEALARVPWNREQGVLLTLSPAAAVPTAAPVYHTDGGLPPESANENEEGPVTSAEAAEIMRLVQTAPGERTGTLRLASVARVWQRRVESFGGVTVVAPPTMIVLNTKPGTPDLFAHLDRTELGYYFLGTLTAAQWRQFASKDGLGRGNLNNEQIALLDKILPDPLTYTSTDTHYRGRVNDPALTHTLTASERQAVRLRVKLQADVNAPMLAPGRTGSYFPVLFDGNRNGGGIFGDRTKAKPFLDLVGDNPYRKPDDVYGQVLSREVRNKPKPADLDFAALSGIVSLAPPSAATSATTGAPPPGLTLAELMPRLRSATGLDLYADARLAKRRVWTRGAESARAGELLQALCFGIAGTVRRVEAPGEKPAYVITSDQEGIAARIGMVNDWQMSGVTRVNKSKAEVLQSIRKINPLSFLDFDDTEPVKLSRVLLERVAHAGSTPGTGRKGYLIIKPSELTAEQQTYLNEHVARSATVKGFEVGSDRYEINAVLWLGMVIPGAGEITDTPLHPISDIVPSDSVPLVPKIAGASLWARVPATDEAGIKAVRELVQAVALRKMQALYLEEASPAVLQAAIAQAKTLPEKSIAIWAVLRPLRLLPTEADTLADLNPRGQTTRQYEESRAEAGQIPTPSLPVVNWRRIARTETLRTLKKQVTEVAAVPGLRGVLIADPLPPGYRNGTKNGVNSGEGNPDNRTAAGQELGWTPEQRLAFLRQYSADPIDVVPYFAFSSVAVPYFPDASHGDDLADAWSQERGKIAQAFLTQLRQALETARPGLPVQVCGQLNKQALPPSPGMVWLMDWPVSVGGNVRLYWNYLRQNVLPATQAKQVMGSALPAQTQARAATRAFLCVSPDNADAALARGGAGWDGVVYDFSDVSPDEVTARVRSLPSPEGQSHP